MATDLASIVLSGARLRQPSYVANVDTARIQGARKVRNLGELAWTVGEFPSLVKAKQEEDEIRDVDSAFSGAMLQFGDPEKALETIGPLAQTLKTPGGVRRALQIAIQG